MPDRKRRFVWQVDTPAGDRLFFNRLAFLRADLARQRIGRSVSRLRRAGAGAYWWVVTYETGRAPRVALGTCYRVSVARAEAARVNGELPFQDNALPPGVPLVVDGV